MYLFFIEHLAVLFADFIFLGILYVDVGISHITVTTCRIRGKNNISEF